MRVLLVEDDYAVSQSIETMLKKEGMIVDTTDLGEDGLEIGKLYDYDIIILDLMLPELSGIEVCRRLRQTSDVPIIMLTAKDDVSDKVMGLDMGADDYMTKPFAIEELLARIRVNLKKHRADRTAGTGARMAGKLRIEPASYGASFDGEPIMLTKKEFDLLNYLWQHEGTAVTRDELLSNVWGYEFAGDTNIVDVYIRYLRQKIDDKFGVKTIHTIRAVGYMFRYE